MNHPSSEDQFRVHHQDTILFSFARGCRLLSLSLALSTHLTFLPFEMLHRMDNTHPPVSEFMLTYPGIIMLMALVSWVFWLMTPSSIFRTRFFLRMTRASSVSPDNVQAEVCGYRRLFDGARSHVGTISTEWSVTRRQMEYQRLVDVFYNLVTDFYEYGWGQSFHFARRFAGEGFDASIARAEHFLALKLGLSPTSQVLDMGCGIGGPMRSMHRFSGATIKGITINEYQVKVANRYNVESGLDKHCHVIQGDFSTFKVSPGLDSLINVII